MVESPALQLASSNDIHKVVFLADLLLDRVSIKLCVRLRICICFNGVAQSRLDSLSPIMLLGVSLSEHLLFDRINVVAGCLTRESIAEVIQMLKEFASWSNLFSIVVTLDRRSILALYHSARGESCHKLHYRNMPCSSTSTLLPIFRSVYPRMETNS